jgi:uncharacterized protein
MDHPHSLRTTWLSLFALILALWITPRPARAGGLDIERPGQRQFVVDHANILDAEAEREIKTVAARLLDEHATPIVVITIESMADHGGRHMDIETFSRILFDQWGVGHPLFEGQAWDTGILLVISKGDRKARIELGTGWAHDKDAEAQRIMNERIIPAFKRGDYSSGTVSGVYALEAMARSKPLPPPQSGLAWWQRWLIYAFTALLVLAILRSLIRDGRGGWGWKFIVLVFTILGGILMILALTNRMSRSCRGRRLGSFGGGRSGGGGATGSW